jgi:hypothetical protein
MKTIKGTDVRPLQVPGQIPAEGIRPIEERPPVVSDRQIDRTEQAPTRLESGPASSVDQTRESSALSVQIETRKWRGKRSKMMRTEKIESMAKQSRGVYRVVLELAVNQARPLLESKPRQAAGPDGAKTAAKEGLAS